MSRLRTSGNVEAMGKTMHPSREIATGYRIEHNIIWGPKDTGLFWLDETDMRIYGPRNPGKYKIEEDGRIIGPDTDGEFFIQNGFIYGPDVNLPWMH